MPEVGHGGNVAWFESPGTSHVWGWKFLDARLSPEIGSASLLIVRFRTKSGGPGGGGEYSFADPDAGQAISDAMIASPHPYGQILYPKVIKGGVPYRRRWNN